MAFVSSKLFSVIKEFVASQVGLVGCQERLNVQAIVGLEIGGVDVRSSVEASILRFPTFHQSEARNTDRSSQDPCAMVGRDESIFRMQWRRETPVSSSCPSVKFRHKS